MQEISEEGRRVEESVKLNLEDKEQFIKDLDEVKEHVTELNEELEKANSLLSKLTLRN